MAAPRAIVSGACCAAALCCGGLSGPPGAALALLALPLPALVAGGVGGIGHAAASSLAAGGLVSALLGWTVGAGFLVLAGLPAVLVVCLLRRAWRLEPVIAAAVGATLSGALVLFLVAHHGESETWSAVAAQTWRQSFEAATQTYREVGVSAETLADLDALREGTARQVAKLLPSLLIVSLGALWLANIGLSRRWAGWPQLIALARWRNADWMIWVLIASGFVTVASFEIVSDVAANLFVLTLACYFAQGIAIVSYFLARLGLPRGLRAATYVFIALQHVAAALVVALGVFDLWGDFRHLAARPADAAVGRDSER